MKKHKADPRAALRHAMYPHIPADFPVKPLLPGEQAEDQTTCFTCGLSWDDAIVTSMTPAPGARCPFEEFHKEQPTAAQHTPGPADYPCPCGCKVRFDGDGLIRLQQCPTHAAAPELLACLETVLSELVLADPTCSGGHRFAAIKNAQRLIAKARS